MSKPKISAVNNSTFQNDLEVHGRASQVRKVLKENVDEHSLLNFSSIKPPPPHLPVEGPDMRPYGEYAALLCLETILANNLMDTKLMLREEKRYLDRHGEAKAGPYSRGRKSFLNGFSNVREEKLYGFYRQTRPFSRFAASWCLEQVFEYFHQDADRFLAFITSHEEAYQQEHGNTISMARWIESKERFRQAFYPDSPAFREFLTDYWGTPGPAENGSCNCQYGNSLYLSFTTEVGIPDKVVSDLADKYSGLSVVHYWRDKDRPQICGMNVYPRQSNE